MWIRSRPRPAHETDPARATLREHPQTGTLIVQTYGFGTRLGYLKLRLAAG